MFEIMRKLRKDQICYVCFGVFIAYCVVSIYNNQVEPTKANADHHLSHIVIKKPNLGLSTGLKNTGHDVIESEQIHSQPSQPTTKVILNCYMRGGSSFLGKMFAQNKEAMYWYEPHAAFYQQAFGVNMWMLPLTLFLDDPANKTTTMGS